MSYINKEKLIECMEAEAEKWQVEDIEYIKSFPVSDVAPVVRGRWVHAGWMCSECGEYLQTFEKPDKVGFCFCPKCGAKNGNAE